MIFSFSGNHCEKSSGRGGFDKALCSCDMELPEVFLECFLRGTPLLTFAESLRGVGEYPSGIVEGIAWSLFAGEIQQSSGSGLRTDLEGGQVIALMTPVELDRVGMALGEVGFSPNIWDM